MPEVLQYKYAFSTTMTGNVDKVQNSKEVHINGTGFWMGGKLTSHGGSEGKVEGLY